MEVRITKDLKYKVEWILRKHPLSMDNDHHLLGNYWQYECKGGDFFSLIKAGKLTPAASILRARRKVQEDNPMLRGANYQGKKRHTQVVQRDLGYGRA